MPPDCKPKHEQSLWEALKESFSLDVDACTRYHQRIMTDPFWEVPPTKVNIVLCKLKIRKIDFIKDVEMKMLKFGFRMSLTYLMINLGDGTF